MMEQRKIFSFANRIYTLLLYAYPASFRREYGRHMTQLFHDEMRDALQENGTTSLIGLWLFTFFDLIKTALAEHTWEALNIMPLEKMTRWSGPAAAIGGILYSLGIIWLWGFENAVNGSLPLVIFTFLVPTFLLGLGLYGLYKRLSQNSGRQNNLAFATALTGLIINNFSIVFLVLIVWNGVCYVCSVGYIAMLFGIAGMGLIALLTQSLGKLSITPLLVAFFHLLHTFVDVSSNFQENASLIIVMILIALSWSLMGVGIMRNENDHEASALTA
jgi:hypothetical protein